MQGKGKGTIRIQNAGYRIQNPGSRSVLKLLLFLYNPYLPEST